MNGDLLQRVELIWQPLLPGAATGLFAAVLLALLGLSWWGSRGASRPRRMSLLLLRGLALAVLFLIALGPTRVRSEGRTIRDPFVVLIDSSRSMRVQDADGASRAEQVGAWLDRFGDAFDELARDYDLRFFLIDEDLRAWGATSPDQGAARFGQVRETAARAGGGPLGGEPSPSDGPGTDLGAGLFALRDALDGSKPAGALLVSDGADRAGLGRAFDAGGAEALAPMLSGLRFPVSTWAVGSPEGPPDLAVADVHAPPFGFVRRPLTVDVDLSSRGLGAGRHLVSLRADGELLSRLEVELADGGEGRVTFEVKPERIGYHTYAVDVPVPAGDTIPGNNHYEFTVKAVRDRTRILQVTSRPAWDVKFLRRLLKTDPHVDLVSFFILRHKMWQGHLAATQELSLIAFPYDELFTQDLQGFDLVILQNFWFGSFASFDDRPYMESLAKYVEDGGALMMIGGDQSFGAAGYGTSPLARILPTAVPRGDFEAASFAAAPTAGGLRHPVTRLERTSEDNGARWNEMPQLSGLNPLGSLQEGAVELLTAGEGGPPLLAVRQVGKGRTLSFASDTSWRWALAGTGGPGGGQDHAEVWRAAVRWLVKDVEQRQIQVITDRENYRLGDTVQAQIRVLADDYSPREGAHVTGTMQPLSGGEALPIDGITDAAGQVTAALAADREGTWKIEAKVAGIPAPFGRAEARVSVADRQGEFEDPRTRADLLAALAHATGGAAFTQPPDPRDAVARPVDALLATDRTVEPLWSHPLLLLLALLPLGSEWILRRRAGLR